MAARGRGADWASPVEEPPADEQTQMSEEMEIAALQLAVSELESQIDSEDARTAQLTRDHEAAQTKLRGLERERASLEAQLEQRQRVEARQHGTSAPSATRTRVHPTPPRRARERAVPHARGTAPHARLGRPRCRAYPLRS